MEAFSHPFRFRGGRAVRLDSASEQYAAQRLAALIQTHQGELSITPTFGSIDQEFSRFYESELLLSVANYMPKIRIDNVSEQIIEDRVSVVVSFTLLQ